MDEIRKTEVKSELPIFIEDEIKSSYLDYSMSVIVSRALPDVRDGLKPVHRRILFAMNDLGMTYDKPYKKSARIVGEVLGKYHPHGDSAVYNAMVRLAQDFNTRYELINGHGNFGSIDGDEAAAMRYTEARMSKITDELLADIDKNTVDFRKNFDESLEEPTVLPAKLPQLLLNGSSGIAVGMATNIPPHNLSEVTDAIVALIDNKDITIDELIEHIKGPDFPTYGVIYGKGGIKEAYSTGRGKIRVAGRTTVEELKNGKKNVVITELPYQVNKARLIEKIADLVKDKKISGISDLRDESDRDGIRVVIELKKGESEELIINKLLKFTDLEVTFGINLLALVDNVPRTLNLKQILEEYLKHRYSVVTRKTIFELDKAEKRAHILEGFKIALSNIDSVIATIKSSQDSNIAKSELMSVYKFSEIQAKSILEMRLQRLTGLERDKIDAEYNDLVLHIEQLKRILKDDSLVYDIIKKEVIELKEKYGDKRRTEIKANRVEILQEDLIKKEEVVITITEKGYVKRMSLDSYKSQRRGGVGSNATNTIEDDYVKQIITANSLDILLVYTNLGRVYKLKSYEIPEATKQARGKLIGNIISLNDDEKVSTIINLSDNNTDKDVLFVTRYGLVNKIHLKEFINVMSNGKNAIRLKENDHVSDVILMDSTKKYYVLLATKYSKVMLYKDELTARGRNTMGVKGINLAKDDIVVSAGIVEENKMDESTSVLTVTDNGFAKMSPITDYRITKRGAKGVKNNRITEKTGDIIGTFVIGDENKDMDLLMISDEGTLIRTSITSISTVSRTARGVTTMKVKENETVVSLALVNKEEE